MSKLDVVKKNASVELVATPTFNAEVVLVCVKVPFVSAKIRVLSVRPLNPVTLPCTRTVTEAESAALASAIPINSRLETLAEMVDTVPLALIATGSLAVIAPEAVKV